MLIWQIDDLQLGQQSFIDDVIEAGFVLEVTGPEMIPGGYRTTITIPGTERVNDTIDTIICLAGNGFTLHDGEIVSFTVFGQSVSVCVCCVYGVCVLCDVVLVIVPKGFPTS